MNKPEELAASTGHHLEEGSGGRRVNEQLRDGQVSREQTGWAGRSRKNYLNWCLRQGKEQLHSLVGENIAETGAAGAKALGWVLGRDGWSMP